MSCNITQQLKKNKLTHLIVLMRTWAKILQHFRVNVGPTQYFSVKFWNHTEQEILLDCDQSNVLLMRIIFFCILLRAFSFFSACIREPASNWDPFNIILIVTGIEVVIGNCLPKVHKILPDIKNWEERISNNGRWR